MPDGGDDRQLQSTLIRRAARCRPANAASTSERRVCGNPVGFLGRAAREHIANPRGHEWDQLFIFLLARQRASLATLGAQLLVRSAFLPGPRKRGLFDENPLPLVPVPGLAGSADNRRSRTG